MNEISKSQRFNPLNDGPLFLIISVVNLYFLNKQKNIDFFVILVLFIVLSL